MVLFLPPLDRPLEEANAPLCHAENATLLYPSPIVKRHTAQYNIFATLTRQRMQCYCDTTAYQQSIVACASP
jgi:hypothetical protein